VIAGAIDRAARAHASACIETSVEAGGIVSVFAAAPIVANPEIAMKREVIRVEPLSTWLERWKAPTCAVTRHGDTVYVSGFPPFDPQTGEVVDAPIERQTELVLQQMKLCLETAGSSLDNILKCNVYCTSVEKFAAVNEVYRRFFPQDPPARIFVNVPAWPGHFDIEIDCVAAV
jgi:2-iminobutanoate/2-iminopropanoate deaminase